MKTSGTTALIVSGALALGLGACGGSSSDGGSSTSASTLATTSTPATTPTTSTTADSTDTSNGSLTPPDAKLGFGDQAMVAWVPPSTYTGNGGQKGYKLQLTVNSIEKGTIDDFKNVQLDDKLKNSTPYYVKVTIKALESMRLGTDDPDITFKAIDDRGQPQSSITFLGDFQRCNDEQVPKPFTSGKTYESCLTYLMPGGGSIESVQWNDGPSAPNEVTPYFDKPIVWSGS